MIFELLKQKTVYPDTGLSNHPVTQITFRTQGKDDTKTLIIHQEDPDEDEIKNAILADFRANKPIATYDIDTDEKSKEE